MRKKGRFHSLKKLRPRQDWSRWSLYSISQLRPPYIHGPRTYFQQKWTAKSLTRAYHGEQIREKVWKRLFKRNLPAVVPMDYKYLARFDGSEQAAGRGAGRDVEKSAQKGKGQAPGMTPYMQMTYYPIERRLDSAIFRSLFASSVRQARQFCVHGLVKVNGKKMVYPGYMLNPGDLFQVEPSSVMYATGAPKKRSSNARKVAKEKASARADEWNQNSDVNPSTTPETEIIAARPEPTPAELKTHMQTLMQDVQAVLEEEVSAKDKQKFRALRQQIRKSIGLWKTASPESVSTLDSQFEFLKNAINTRAAQDAAEAESAEDAESKSIISEDDKEKLREAFEKLKLETQHTSEWNKRNAAAPYATPWRPRDYMSAFAFIPRYLEVNQNVCAAVYLRHPVARPNLAEVPTPFHLETGQLAFNWYLRRR